jgi:hypothetical protein
VKELRDLGVTLHILIQVTDLWVPHFGPDVSKQIIIFILRNKGRQHFACK